MLVSLERVVDRKLRLNQLTCLQAWKKEMEFELRKTLKHMETLFYTATQMISILMNAFHERSA